MSIKFDASSFFTQMAKLEAKSRAGAKLYGQVAADKMASQAKMGAPWTDRTSNARQSIQGFSYFEKSTLFIGISGGVDYFPYLELANEKKYAILYPTLQEYQDEIIRGVSRIFKT